jgi:DNA processing protein
VRGCHELIRNGAKLVESPEDIREELSTQFDTGMWASQVCEHSAPVSAVKLSQTEQKILELMGHQHCTLDALVAQSDTDLQSLNALLLELESKGVIGTDAGRYVRLQ